MIRLMQTFSDGKRGQVAWVASDANTPQEQAEELRSMTVQLRLPESVQAAPEMAGDAPYLELYGSPRDRVLRWLNTVREVRG